MIITLFGLCNKNLRFSRIFSKSFVVLIVTLSLSLFLKINFSSSWVSSYQWGHMLWTCLVLLHYLVTLDVCTFSTQAWVSLLGTLRQTCTKWSTLLVPVLRNKKNPQKTITLLWNDCSLISTSGPALLSTKSLTNSGCWPRPARTRSPHTRRLGVRQPSLPGLNNHLKILRCWSTLPPSSQSTWSHRSHRSSPWPTSTIPEGLPCGGDWQKQDRPWSNAQRSLVPEWRGEMRGSQECAHTVIFSECLSHPQDCLTMAMPIEYKCF